MLPSKTLVIYKKSLYHLYFLERRHSRGALPPLGTGDLDRYRRAHEAHTRTMATVRQVLERRRLHHRFVYRARQVDYRPYDLVLAVGGDGTFLEAARRVTTQRLLGVNSDPERSTGFFCACDAATFELTLEALRADTLPLRQLTRLAFRLDGRELPFHALNDVLIAHRYPAAMSRYLLALGDVEEEQRGSGLWVSTAAGSSGGIRSAGGRAQPLSSRRLQYLPRELYHRRDQHYRLRGGLVPPGQSLVITSRMREGELFVDGPHLRLPFPVGRRLELCPAAQPLRVYLPAPPVAGPPAAAAPNA